VIVFFTAYAFSILAQKYEKVNGLLDYAEATCGSKYAYYLGWYMTMIYTPGITSVLGWVTARYLCGLFGFSLTSGETMVVAGLILVADAFLNAISPKLASKTQISTTVIKLIPLILMAAVGMFAGLGVLGGSSLRDFAIVATSFGAKLSEIKKCGLVGIIALFAGVISAFVCGALAAFAFGYTDAVSVSTIASGAVTFVVGPVTGAALGAESTVIAISIAAGVFKSIAVMLLTPVVAKKIGLTTPRAAMIFGGLMGTTSGTSAGLAATDASLVPYGAMTSTFYTGLGCLLCPSVLYSITTLFLS